MRTIRIGFGLGNQSTRSPLEPVLIPYNWPKNTDRYRRAQGFVEAFSLGPPPFASCRATQNAARSLSLRIGRLGSFRAGPGCEANKTQQAWWLSVSPDDPQPTKDPAVPPSVDLLLFQQFLEWRRSTGGKQRDGVR